MIAPRYVLARRPGMQLDVFATRCGQHPDMGSLVAGATCPNCGKRSGIRATAQGKPRCALCHRWLPWIAESGDEDFTEIVETSSVPVLVDLWATWCGPCRMVSPALEQLATECAGQLKLVKVNVDKAPVIAHQFAVQAVPTVLVLNDYEVLGRQSGAAPVAALRNWLDRVLTGTRTKETRSRRR
jgi:thioredoxin 2